jgi:CelD/BcsL family acetyltransferase involved in cellulose biosynthesis
LARVDRAGGYDLSLVREVGPLVDEWAALADRVAAPAALHPGHVRAWVDAYSAPGRLRVATARRDGELAALLPAVLSRRGLSAGLYRYDVEVGVVADGPESAEAAMTAALGLPRARLQLRPVPEESPAHRALGAAAARAGRPMLERSVETQSYIDMAGDWEDYWKARGSKLRGDIKRRRRRLEELGEVTVEAYDPAALDAALDEAFGIEASGWKGRGGTAISDRPADERFNRALARWADGRGWFRLWFLRLDGRAIAFRFGVEAFGVYSSLKIGYLEEYGAQSPGKVLEAAVIEELHRGECRRFEYAGELSDHKARWATGTRELLELSAFPPTVAGRAGWAAGALRARTIPLVKRAKRRLRSIR